jgi:hypothetical protein
VVVQVLRQTFVDVVLREAQGDYFFYDLLVFVDVKIVQMVIQPLGPFRPVSHVLDQPYLLIVFLILIILLLALVVGIFVVDSVVKVLIVILFILPVPFPDPDMETEHNVLVFYHFVVDIV